MEAMKRVHRSSLEEQSTRLQAAEALAASLAAEQGDSSAAAAGHQNHKQRVRYLTMLKAENTSLHKLVVGLQTKLAASKASTEGRANPKKKITVSFLKAGAKEASTAEEASTTKEASTKEATKENSVASVNRRSDGPRRGTL